MARSNRKKTDDVQDAFRADFLTRWQVLDISHTMQLHKNCPPEYRRDPYIVDGAGRETAIYSKINLHLSSSVTDYHT